MGMGAIVGESTCSLIGSSLCLGRLTVSRVYWKASLKKSLKKSVFGEIASVAAG
jgi:hypothetical protein